jgi:hypothetical protein
MQLRQGWSLLRVVALCVGMAGCAGQRDDSLRLSEELGRARADAAWQQAHAAELESRMLRLEQRTAVTPNAQHAADGALLSRLDRLIALNERLLAERAAAPVTTSGVPKEAPAAHALPPTAASVTSNGTPTLSDEQELRALVVRLRGRPRPGSPHGGLTREQEAALRVLTRPERELDKENPLLAIY